MGSDNLYHKRKAKKAKDLARRKSKRAPYDKVLIVCEGEKTEPNYVIIVKHRNFDALSANILSDLCICEVPVSRVEFLFLPFSTGSSPATGESSRNEFI